MLSRRIEVGEAIELQGPDGKRFLSEIIDIDKKTLSIEAIREVETPLESKLKITIFQALIKEQPLDFIIQKSTELGVAKLCLFHAENSVERFKEIDKKLARWKKISEEATKQSGRVRPIEIEYLDSDVKLEELLKQQEFVFLLDPPSDETLARTWASNTQVESIGILIGPEGGFTDQELHDFSKNKNVVPINMGPRILRADTAVISSSAIIQSLWGDM